MEVDVGLVGQRAAHRLANHRLIVHQQDHDVVLRGLRQSFRFRRQRVIDMFVSHV